MTITCICNKENEISIQPKEFKSEVINIYEEKNIIKIDEIQKEYLNTISKKILMTQEKEYKDLLLKAKNDYKKIKFDCEFFKIKAVINENYIKENNRYFVIQKIIELTSPLPLRSFYQNYDFTFLNLKDTLYHNANINKTFSGKIKYYNTYNKLLVNTLFSYCFASCYLKKEEVSF